MSYKKTLIVVAGPTASGKSDLAIKLAQTFQGEIICSDSMQIYRNLNIGTSKPTKKEQKLIPHHLIDLIDPNENYSAGKYERDASQIISEIHSRRHTPIIVGGSGLYFRALMYGFSKIPKIPEIIKKKVVNLHIKHGTRYCWEKLEKLDKLSAKDLHPNDTSRILRSLQVFLATGYSIKKFQKDNPFLVARYPCVAVAIEWERNLLYERINKRTLNMLKSGWINEVETLLKYYPKESTPFQSIGYSEIIQHLSGKLELNQMIQKIQQRTRNYAKRQITWFRKESMIEWFQPGDVPKVFSRVKVFLEK
tara:strand:- start:400 stop:1320 length:921 start_codon:yes stop_codon:yes gene_type:complete